MLDTFPALSQLLLCQAGDGVCFMSIAFYDLPGLFGHNMGETQGHAVPTASAYQPRFLMRLASHSHPISLSPEAPVL